MNKHISFLLIVVFPLLSFAQRILVIKNAVIVNVKTGHISRGQTVMIQGDTITSIGRKIKIPASAKIIEAKGKYLIPGLWDMHVHALTKERIETFFPLFIANGVTGIRNMGTTMPLEQINELKKEIEQGKILGPRFLASGPIVDGPVSSNHLVVTNETEGRKDVDSLRQRGADFIKVYQNLSRESFFAIADECKKLKIPFAGHLPIPVSAFEASDAGQKSFEHLGQVSGGLLLSCSDQENEIRKDRLDAITTPKGSVEQSMSVFNATIPKILKSYNSEKAKNLISTLARNKTWQCPTLVILNVFTFPKDSNPNAPQLPYLIGSERQSQNPKNSPVFKNQNVEVIESYKQLFQKSLSFISDMNRAGVKFLAGTDAPVFLTVPGFSLHHELEFLVKAGLSPIGALRAATLNPARFFDKEKEWGTVEKGKLADLVLLDANPLEDISNTKKIYAVILKGKLLQRTDLDRMLERVKQLAKN